MKMVEEILGRVEVEGLAEMGEDGGRQELQEMGDEGKEQASERKAGVAGWKGKQELQD